MPPERPPPSARSPIPCGSLPMGWEAPPGVGAYMSTRQGGHSLAPFDGFNLGEQVGDDAEAVRANRAQLQAAIGVPLVWLHQVHGAHVVDAQQHRHGSAPRADGCVSTTPGLACVVQVADCLPVLMAAERGGAVGAAHAGWRGLAAGVVEATLQRVCEAARCAPREVLAWLGPCIGPQRFEVGADVLEALGESPHFKPAPRPDGSARWLADLPALARERLQRLGVTRIAGGHWCTVQDAQRFYSFRRDGRTGRMAAAVWIRE